MHLDPLEVTYESKANGHLPKVQCLKTRKSWLLAIIYQGLLLFGLQKTLSCLLLRHIPIVDLLTPRTYYST